MALAFKRSEDSQVESKIAPDAVEAEILREVRRATTPMKVVLFGSRARGDAHSESDYDVLVALPDSANLKAERAALSEAASRMPVKVQFLVKHWSEYQALQGVSVGLWRNIRDDGITLYEQERVAQPTNNPLEMKTNQDIAKTLLEIAKSDYERATILYKVMPSDMEGIGFNCQQAVEKSLKAALAFSDIHFPRTHELGDLLNLLSANRIAFDERLSDAAKLNEFAVDMRYDKVDFDLDAETALELAKRAIDFAENLTNLKP